MGTDWIAAIASIRGNIAVYLARNGKLDAKQTAALATDLKTLDRDLAGLSASLAAPQTAAPAAGGQVIYAKGWKPLPKVAVPDGLGVSSVRGTVDLSSPSPDTYWYMRQILELTRDPSLVAKLTGIWPSEALQEAWRFATNAQLVGDYLVSGPAYERLYPALSNADILLAFANKPGELNPIILAGLDAAAAEADANPDGFVDLGTDATIRVITIANTPGTAWGQIAVSGRFATFEVLGQ